MSGPLTIKRTIVVKAKVTEEFKKQMASELQDAIRNLDAELQQLDFQEKRMVLELERKNLSAIPAARQQVEKERQKRMQARTRLTEQLKSMGQLAIGSEVAQGTLESITEINVGDDWNDIFGIEVVVCDNKIIEIRRRQEDKKKINEDK